MSERVDLDGDGDDLPRFETMEGFRRCRLLLSFKARSSGAGRMFQIGWVMAMMSAASPVYWTGGSIVQDKERATVTNGHAASLGQHPWSEWNIQSSRDGSVNVRLKSKQNFEAREPEMRFFAALRATFYKKRAGKVVKGKTKITPSFCVVRTPKFDGIALQQRKIVGRDNRDTT
ncbi:hypothetical protein F4604DRAFT_1907671 [Suillus subluteus]|nr:hypothetical protein F4604DRAFT_1907671 [Suillus subluteus]